MSGFQKLVTRLRRQPSKEIDKQPGFYRGNADERPQRKTEDHDHTSKVEILSPSEDTDQIPFDPDKTCEPDNCVHAVLPGSFALEKRANGSRSARSGQPP